MSELRWHPQVEHDWRRARYWYAIEQEAPEQVPRLDRAVREAVRWVQVRPHSWPIYHGAVHKRHVPGFPYRILYEERDGCVFILALMHEKQHPRPFLRRV